MFMLKNTKTSQLGFSVPHLLPIVLVIAIIGLAGANVYQAQQRKSEQTRQAAAEADRKKQQLAVKDEEKQETVKIPATEEQKKTVDQPAVEAKPKTTPKTETKPKPTVVVKNIETTSAQVGAENVVLTAKLPGTFTGYCKVMFKQPDGSNVQYLDANFGPADTCSISVPRSKLTAGNEWKYYMQFKSSDGLTRGEHGGNVFSL